MTGGPIWFEAADRLRNAAVETPRLEAQLLLGLALGASRTQIITATYSDPSPQQISEFNRLLEARIRRVPLAYLRGSQEFYGLDFEVAPGVLIPRPETEMLVDYALERIAGRSQFLLADVGTGSGCIPISILANSPSPVLGMACDISETALFIALTNAERHSVLSRLGLVRSDFLSVSRPSAFDLILSNPPYIETSEIDSLQPEVSEFEPRLALDGGPDGLAPYRILLPQIFFALKPGGSFAVEAGMGQADAVAEIAERSGFVNIRKTPDLAGIERMTTGEKP